MSTFLQRSAAWIESTFLYASTVFDPDSINVDNGEWVMDSTGKAHNNDNSDNAKEDEEEEEEEAPQTEDTIPSGLVSSQRYNNDNNSINGILNGGTQQRRLSSPPSRRGKFVQVLHSGGNLDYYTNHTTNNNDSSNNSAASSAQQSLPPHIVISDGEYCCIAFLSPETCVAYSNEQIIKNGQRGPCHLPSKRSIISISQYTVSTILQCCRSHTTTRQEYDDIMSPLPAAAAAAAQMTHNNNNNNTRRESTSSSSMDKSRSRDSDMTVPLPIDLQAEMNSTIQSQVELDLHLQIMSQLLFTDIPIRFNNSDYVAAAAAAALSLPRSAGRTYQLIPLEIQRQLRTQIPDIQLYLCLYIQGPITFVGAENGGLIGDPIDVHCSVTLRRGLMHHLHSYGPCRKILGNDEGYSHSMLIRRLEACHEYYYLLDHNNNNDSNNVQQQLIRGGGDGLQDTSSDDTDDEHVVVRKKCKTKKRYGKGNTKRVVLGGRERRGGNNNDRDNSSSSGSSSTMKWPWKSCLTITQDIPILPLPSSSPPIDEIVGIGLRNDDRSNNPVTDAAAIGGGREAESINVQIIMQNDDTTPPSPVFGVRGKSIATGHGNVTELFDSTQDIFDILGLEEDYDPIDPVTTTTITTDAVNNNHASVVKNNDKNDTNEIDSCDEDSGPTFVGIDDMIIDDDNEEEEEMANTTAGHQEFNFSNDDGMTQDYLLSQPPDATSRRSNDNEDAVSLLSLLADEESTSPTHRHPRRMPRRNLPRTSSPLPSRPVHSTTRNKKVVVNHQQAVEKEDVPVDTNHTEQQQQQQERPKRGIRKPRDTIQIPIHLRKAPPETLGLASASALSLAWTEKVDDDDDDDNEEGVYRQESQIPMPLMRNRKRDDEEEEDTVHYESQIPLMTKKSKLTNDELIGHVDQQHEQYDVMESQLPLPQRPSRATLPSSQKNRNDNDNDSEDSEDLMRIRRTKPKEVEWIKVSKDKSVPSTATAASSDESSTSDLFVESQIAGEGSDETLSPPSSMPSDSKSPLKKRSLSTIAAAAATTNQDTDQDNKDHHRVRFAIDQTTTTIDNRDVSLRILGKIDRILGIDNGSVSTVKCEERKRKASETFNNTKFMDKVKRLCGE